jgi:hypothetical protein
MDIYEPPVWAKTAFISLISLALVIFELVAIIDLILVMATLGVITGVEVTVKVLFPLHCTGHLKDFLSIQILNL